MKELRIFLKNIQITIIGMKVVIITSITLNIQ